MNILPEITCPFPSYKDPEKFSQFTKENPLHAHKKLYNESILTNRIFLTALGTLGSAYLLSYPAVYASAILVSGSIVSLPCTLLGTGTYFLLEGAHSIANTKEMTDLFQNLCWGGIEMGAGLLMLYFYDIAPVGVVEPQLKQIANESAAVKGKTILYS